MAIYIYNTTGNTLFSYIPENETIAQAQAAGQLASNATLTQNGLAAIDGLVPLDSTHVWNVATASVSVVTAPTPAAPMPAYFFFMRFTPTEFAGIEASTDPTVVQWWRSMKTATIVDLSDQSVITNMHYLSNNATANLMTSSRVVTIITAPFTANSAMH